MSTPIVVNLIAFAAILAALTRLHRPAYSLSARVLAGLVAGLIYGLALQLVYSGDTAILSGTLEWTNVVASGYINLLRMIVMPLVLVMMVGAVLRMHELRTLGTIGASIIGLLIGTTMVAALVGILMASGFGLTAEGLAEGARELATLESLELRQESIADLTLADMLVAFIPSNIFHDLTGARDTSVIAVVLFGILFGIAALLVANDDAERGERIRYFVETGREIVMKLVSIVMALTPYGILALMSNVVASANGADILSLIAFVVASYLAIAVMFGVHAAMLKSFGIGLKDYFRKVWPVLTFAFGSRSSAATIPISVKVQVEALDVPQPVANLSASFGATIGQNGCAGIYPAMLATMIAPTVGIDPLSISFIAGLVVVVAISSFGIAGVGGGATYAALVVLPVMGFPITIVALLVSIEPLIDMARTALNVNGSITAGVLTGRLYGRGCN